MSPKRRRFAARRRSRGYSQEAFAEAVGVERTTVTRWESADTEPQPWHRNKIAKVLNVSLEELDELLADTTGSASGASRTSGRVHSEPSGTAPDRTSGLVDGEDDEMNRRELLVDGLVASGAMVASVRSGTAGTLLSNTDEDLLRMVTSAYRRLEASRPSGMLIDPVVGCVGFIRGLVRTDGPASGRLYAVLSEAAGLAAWLYVDLNNVPEARRYYLVAIDAATRSGHPLLPLYMRASLGQFAADTGDTSHGLKLVRDARHRLPSNAPPVAHVWLDAVEARVMAQQHDQDAMILLRRTGTRLKTGHEPVWPWLNPFDHLKFAGYRAVCATRLKHTSEARTAFADAAAVTPTPKQHAMLQVEQARCLWEAGDAHEACALVVAALDTAGDIGSERVYSTVRTLRADMGDRAGSVAAEVDDRLAAVYGRGV